MLRDCQLEERLKTTHVLPSLSGLIAEGQASGKQQHGREQKILQTYYFLIWKSPSCSSKTWQKMEMGTAEVSEVT